MMESESSPIGVPAVEPVVDTDMEGGRSARKPFHKPSLGPQP